MTETYGTVITRQLKHELKHFVAMRLCEFDDEAIRIAENSSIYKNLIKAVDETYNDTEVRS